MKKFKAQRIKELAEKREIERMSKDAEEPRDDDSRATEEWPELTPEELAELTPEELEIVEKVDRTDPARRAEENALLEQYSNLLMRHRIRRTPGPI